MVVAGAASPASAATPQYVPVNCGWYLQPRAAGGFADLIDTRVDGLVAAHDGLRGKPQPDTFLAGASLEISYIPSGDELELSQLELELP